MRIALVASVVAALVPCAVAHGSPLSRYGVGITLGGGVEGFTDPDLAESADTGAAWGIRAIVGTRTPFSLEAAYQGSAQSVDAFGLDNAALLVSNGLEAGVRFNAWPGSIVVPYVSMGLGWRRYDLTQFEANFSDVSETDHVVELPLGAGVAVHLGGVLFDARVQFRPARGAELVPDDRSADGEHLAMHRWGVTGNLGYEF